MSRPAIPARVTRLLPLLSSPSDGEALNTRDAIVQTLAAVGLDLNDLAAAIVVVDVKPASLGDRPPSPTAVPGFFDLARACRDLDRGCLTPRERAFVGEMVRQGRLSPSPRQAAWIGDIFAKLQSERAA